MLWTEGDHTFADQVGKERRADVSNVVLGKEYSISQPPGNGKRGYILTHADNIPSAQSPVELVVVSWSQKSSMPYNGGTYDYWDVHFKVLAYNQYGGVSESIRYDIPNPPWDPGYGSIPAIENYPCVTAHIKYDAYQQCPLLVVDVAFQRGCYYNGLGDQWTVCHAQYLQANPNSYDSLIKVGPQNGVDRIAPADPFHYYAIHPDIVYGTYWRRDLLPSWPWYIDYDIDYLMVVFEVVNKQTSQASIVYAQSDIYPDNHYPLAWFYDLVSGATGSTYPVIPQYPRIDAGIDCSDPRFENPQFYIAAVVWHSVYSANPPLLTSVLFFNYKPFNVSPGPPHNYQRFLPEPFLFDQFDTTAAPNGLPYVEVDPMENVLDGHCPQNYTHMVWTRFMDQQGHNIKPYYTNSELVMHNPPEYAIRRVANGGADYREGLTTISTYTDQTTNDPYDKVGTIQFISAQNEATEYPVYSVDFWYVSQDPQTLHFEPPEPVSDSGNSSSDEFPWECGPSSAMRGGDVTFCAWTKKSDLTYYILWDHDL